MRRRTIGVPAGLLVLLVTVTLLLAPAAAHDPIAAFQTAPVLDSTQATRGIEQLFRPDRVRVSANASLTESRAWRTLGEGLYWSDMSAADTKVSGRDAWQHHRWQEIDTLWARENMGRRGAMATGEILAVVGGLIGIGMGAATNNSGDDPGPIMLGTVGFVTGGVAGLTLGRVFGSLGRRWVRVYPGTTPGPEPDPRSRPR